MHPQYGLMQPIPIVNTQLAHQQAMLAAAKAQAIQKEDEGTPIEVKHNSTYNLNTILAQNIYECSYFKNVITELNDLDDILEEIVAEVWHLEPTTKNRTPSRAFCLLFRLMVMKLNEEKLTKCLNHDCPFVRGIGYLYIRFLVPPKKLWMWFRGEFHKQDEIQVSREGEKDTIFTFLLRLINETKYFGMPMPKIPIPVHRAYRRKVVEMRVRTERNAKYRHVLEEGTKVEGMYHEDTQYYPCSIVEELDNGNYKIYFDEYSEYQEVSIGQIKIPKSLKKRRRRSRSRDRDRDRKKRRRRNSRSSSRSRSRRSRSRERITDRYRGGSSRDARRGKRRRSPSYDDGSASDTPDIEEMIREEDRSAQLSSSARHCAERAISYNRMLSTSGMDAGRLFEPDNFTRAPLVVNMPSNKMVCAPRRRKPKETSSRKRLEETTQVRVPTKQHIAKMHALRQRYGDASAVSKEKNNK